MRHILLCAGLILVTMQSEGGVFKCQTQNGFVYSERPCAGDAKAMEYRAPPPPAAAASAPVDVSRAENGGTTANANAGTPQTCLKLARAMVDKKDMNPARIRADSKQLLDLCPSTAYECVTYIQRPEANNCKAVPMQPGGSIVSNNTYTR